MKKTRTLLFLSSSLLPIANLQAAIVVDGSLDTDYGPALAVQTVDTLFGNNTDPSGFGGGGELNAAYGRIENSRLYLLFTGNVEPNFNNLSVFIDSVSGGENVLNGGLAYGFANVASNFGGMTFDSGFTADYHLYGRWGGGAFELDIVNRNLSIPGAELGNSGVATVGSGTGIQSGTISAGGTVTLGADAGGFLVNDVPFGFNNTNIAGVGGGTGAADQLAAQAVATGLEISIALADLGNPAPGTTINISAAYGNGDNNFHSNQILGGLEAPQGNLGGDGAGAFTGNLSGVDFNNFDGDQFFSIVVPEPSSALSTLIGLLMLVRRRR